MSRHRGRAASNLAQERRSGHGRPSGPPAPAARVLSHASAPQQRGEAPASWRRLMARVADILGRLGGGTNSSKGA